MINRATIFTLLIPLIACQSQSNFDISKLSQEEQKSIASLAWLQQADVEQDIQTALAKNDNRLLVMAGRSASLPGVPEELSARAKTACGVRYLEGSTDQVQGNTHRQLLQVAYDYAKTYNQALLKHCLKNNH